MDQHRKELLCARISSGTCRLRVRNEREEPVVVSHQHPSRERRYEASEFHQEAYESALADESYSDEDLLSFLLDQGVWSEKKQRLLDKYEKDIDDFKVSLLSLAFRSVEQARVRGYLAEAKKRRDELFAERHSHDHLSAHGVAGMARARFLLQCSLFFPDGRAVLPPEADYSSVVFDNAAEAFFASRLGDAEYRELARTDPWRTIWSASKRCGSAFGVPSIDLTEEQSRLQGWSQLYERVESHPECPDEDSMADDDLFDGWLISQRRKAKQKRVEASAESAGGDKVSHHDEIYIVADTPEDARRIEAMNGPGEMAIKRAREALLRKQGVVNELDMPDVKQRLQSEVLAKIRG